jgi:hypothetical protein
MIPGVRGNLWIILVDTLQKRDPIYIIRLLTRLLKKRYGHRDLEYGPFPKMFTNKTWKKKKFGGVFMGKIRFQH